MKNSYDVLISDILDNMFCNVDKNNVNVRVVENGVPVVDIKNGENMLNKKNDPNYIKVPKDMLTEEGICKYVNEENKDLDYVFVPISDLMAPCENNIPEETHIPESNVETVNNSSDKDDLDESEIYYDSEEEYGPGERFTNITKDIYKDDFDETYFVRKAVNGNRIISEIPITFDYTAEDGVTTPGVTERDLALILLYRNRNNEVKYNALMEFLKLL